MELAQSAGMLKSSFWDSTGCLQARLCEALMLLGASPPRSCPYTYPTVSLFSLQRPCL